MIIRDEKGHLRVGTGWIFDAVKAAIITAQQTGRDEVLNFNDVLLTVRGESDAEAVTNEYYTRHETRRLEIEAKKSRAEMLEWEIKQRDQREALIQRLGLTREQRRLIAQEIREALKGHDTITEGMYRLSRLGAELDPGRG